MVDSRGLHTALVDPGTGAGPGPGLLPCRGEDLLFYKAGSVCQYICYSVIALHTHKHKTKMQQNTVSDEKKNL